MNRSVTGVTYIISVVLVCLTTLSSPAWAGGSDDEAPDAHQDNGPSYFGFVKDQAGKPVPDAKVTAEIKGRGSVITRTNGAGIYKLPGFGKEITEQCCDIVQQGRLQTHPQHHPDSAQ